jgi:hypothetical protein
LLTFPPDDERDQIAELIRRLPAQEVAKLKRELTKAAKDAAKEAAKATKTSSARSRA